MSAHAYAMPLDGGLALALDSADERSDERACAAPATARTSALTRRKAALAGVALVLLAAPAAMLAAGKWPGGSGAASVSRLGAKDIDEQQVQLTFTCKKSEPHRLLSPALDGIPLKVKILTYNLFWWNMFKKYGGKGGSAGRLISANNDPPFDFMGLQECEDPTRVLSDAGMLKDYASLLWGSTSTGTHAVAMVYRKTSWKLLEHGRADVAEDAAGKFYYGTRGAQWMRLQHLTTNKTVFFMNHHGPLPLHSGGHCGGYTTAHNLLNLVAKAYKPGDTVIFTGDFNAGTTSQTVQELGHYLVSAMNGNAFGGVDNIFVNLPERHIVGTKNMGPGGSDHDALSLTIQLGVDKFKTGVKYQMDSGKTSHKDHIATPEKCASLCQDSHACKSWTWSKKKACELSSALPVKVVKGKKGFSSGLPVRGGKGKPQEFSPKVCSPLWGQCGGSAWRGPKCCKGKMVCKASGSYFSQCTYA